MSAQDLVNFKVSSGCARAYVQGADATGDVIHVYGAMQADPTAALVVFQWDANTGAAIRQKMLTLGIAGQRILVQIEAGGRNPVRNRVTKWCRQAGFETIDLHESTDNAILALQNEGVRKSMHVTLRGARDITADDQKFLDFWVAKFQAVQIGANAVILWGRSSGKDKTTADKFGAHPYGDSSTAGLIQVAAKCLEKAWKVILCGDINPAKRNRFPAECIFIGKFWDDPLFAARLTQKEQVRCFYMLKRVLKEEDHRMVHVGMRSGNLDYYAFAGQTIVYLVAQGFDDRRIEKLVAALPERWLRSQPDKTPRHGYQLNWDPEWLDVVGRTDLRLLVGDAPLQRQREMFQALGYPIDPQTQINGNLLYRFIKAKLKENAAYAGAGPDVLHAFLAETTKRGFSDNYLIQLIGVIEGALA
jgi:hypothetical protein